MEVGCSVRFLLPKEVLPLQENGNLKCWGLLLPGHREAVWISPKHPPLPHNLPEAGVGCCLKQFHDEFPQASSLEALRFVSSLFLKAET